MLMGTFFRGPNWSFFGFVRNVGRAQGRGAEQRAVVGAVLDRLVGPAVAGGRGGVGGLARLGCIVLRELPGSCCWAATFWCCPVCWPDSAGRVRSCGAAGTWRYLITMWLLLTMGLLPLKMICRWLFNMNYFVSIPEFFLNF